MPLTDEQIAKFKSRLLQLKNQHSRSFEETSENVKSTDESKGASQHPADEGTEDFERIISIELTSKEVDIIRQIDRALEKIEEGTYGICDISGKEIALKRLEAIPYATLTIEAQEAREQGKA